MKKLLLIFATTLFALSMTATADTITLSAVSSNTQGGVYTAPYFLSVNGSSSFGAMCVDFSHETAVGQSWDGDITNLASADLSGTRLGVSGHDTYREEAWLYQQFLDGAGPSGDINFAVWALTDASAKSSAGWTTGAQHWFDLATTTDLSSFDSAMVHFNVITPRDLTGAGPQEFITTNNTPEPAGLLLLGSGMLGMVGLVRKKIR